MADRSQTEIEAQAELNRRRLLAAETGALFLLLRRRNSAVKAGLSAGNSPTAIADRIESSWRRAIVEARSTARMTGLTRLRAEVASAGFRIGTGSSILAEELGRDAVRARSIAKNYAARWFRKATGATTTEAAARAQVATVGSVRRIGVTESSEAFTAGRAKYIRRFPRLGLLRIWDARLDSRVCPLCSDLDGTIVGIRENFPHGEPGSLHSWCRCSWAAVTPSESETLLELKAA